MNLERKVNAIEPKTETSPWPGHEHVRGYAVMELPFSSGHLLGLRVWPESDFVPWVSVWHRTPEGEWSMFNDGVSLDMTCPRYWKPVVQRAELANIDVSWTGANELRIEMDEPRLVWTMIMSDTPILRGLNAVSELLPRWSWKPAPLLRMREWIARNVLRMGDIRLSFTSPSGHETVTMPKQIFFIDDAEAIFDGQSLGTPIRLDTNPTIGGVPTPVRPIFALGQARMRITDVEEYHRTRERIHVDSFDSNVPQHEAP